MCWFRKVMEFSVRFIIFILVLTGVELFSQHVTNKYWNLPSGVLIFDYSICEPESLLQVTDVYRGRDNDGNEPYVAVANKYYNNNTNQLLIENEELDGNFFNRITLPDPLNPQILHEFFIYQKKLGNNLWDNYYELRTSSFELLPSYQINVLKYHELVEDSLNLPVSYAKNESGNGFWIIVAKSTIEDPHYLSIEFENGEVVRRVRNTSVTIKQDFLDFDYIGGELKLSPNGDMLARVYELYSEIDLYSFDRQTGVINDLHSLNLRNSGNRARQSVEFSPNQNYLYVKDGQEGSIIGQLDISLNNPTAIENSYIEIASFEERWLIGDLRLAPNGKIYFMRSSYHEKEITDEGIIGEIACPNSNGANCNIDVDAIEMFGRHYYDLGIGLQGENVEYPSFTFEADYKTKICKDDTLVFEVRNAYCSFIEWDLPNGSTLRNEELSQNLGFAVFGNNDDQIGEYTFRVIQCDSVYEESFILERIEESPEILVSNDILLCSNESATLSSLKEADNYYWNGIRGNRDLIIDNPGTFELTTVFGSCSFTNQIEISEFDLRNITIEATDEIAVCSGQTATFSVTLNSEIFEFNIDEINLSENLEVNKISSNIISSEELIIELSTIELQNGNYSETISISFLDCDDILRIPINLNVIEAEITIIPPKIESEVNGNRYLLPIKSTCNCLGDEDISTTFTLEFDSSVVYFDKIFNGEIIDKEDGGLGKKLTIQSYINCSDSSFIRLEALNLFSKRLWTDLLINDIKTDNEFIESNSLTGYISLDSACVHSFRLFEEASDFNNVSISQNSNKLNIVSEELFKDGLEIEIYDIRSQKKFQGNINYFTNHPLDLTNFDNGVYFVVLKSRHRSKTLKFYKIE